MAKSNKDTIAQDEKKLLSKLVKNSKENIDTIAKHCGFSRQKAWRMIKQLEAKGLI
jgi:DNA-binding Lrp family transcriptional regulator